jgi:hypothetical protein
MLIIFLPNTEVICGQWGTAFKATIDAWLEGNLQIKILYYETVSEKYTWYRKLSLWNPSDPEVFVFFPDIFILLIKYGAPFVAAKYIMDYFI